MAETAAVYSVLSIQSYVVHGYVGNRVAVFVLQSLGIEIDAINSVQFSNHTGYPSWTGKVLSSEEMWNLYEGLLENNLVNYSHILTGYIKNPDCMKVISRIIEDAKRRNPNLIYVCDPVFGDNGSLYKSVKYEMVDLYRRFLIPLSTILKLNQTEAEFLSNIKINSEESLIEAIDALHALGAKHVIISSLFLNDKKDRLFVYGSSLIPDRKIYHFSVPYINFDYSGTGDFFSALLLGYSTKTDVITATYKTVCAIRAVLEASLGYKELQLVKYSKFINDPPALDSVIN